MKALILAVLFFQIHFSSAQNNFELKPEDIFLKGSYNYSYRNNTGKIILSDYSWNSAGINSGNWVQIFGGSLGYQYNKTIQFEVSYSQVTEQGLSDIYIRESNPEKKFYSYRFSKYSSSDITFRANIFPNPDRRINPVYFTGGITFSVQPVENRAIDEFEDKTEILNYSYTRMAAGPLAGVGIFWDFGNINFTTEFTFTARYSIGRRDIFETAMNFTFSPVLKL